MPTIPQFDPPGGLTDFTTSSQRDAWDRFINQNFQRNIQEVESELGAGQSQFYNPKVTSTDPPVATAVIRWKGFPLVILSRHPGNKRAAWTEADQLTPQGFRPQDEYLEWHVTKNQQGKITRVDFTCEGPEYWDALANDRTKLLQLYHDNVSPDVQLADLLNAGGTYNRLNKWNTEKGAMHLSHPANTLGAEINIAALATIKRIKGGQVLTDPDALIVCSGYGERLRASDPHIGAEVNALAREGYAITLQNPVGLYIDSLEATGWTTPNGNPAIQFWKSVRGAAGMTVRAKFEVPAGDGYTVGDIKIGGQNIEFGGQIAEHINVKLTGIACRKGQINNAPQPCPGSFLGGANAIRRAHATATAPETRSSRRAIEP